MLALTDNAVEAIEGILNAPGVPDGSGVRIAAAPGSEATTAGQLQVGIAQVPADGDRVIDDHGARVFVQDEVADSLDHKLLDASIDGGQVSFAIGDQVD